VVEPGQRCDRQADELTWRHEVGERVRCYRALRGWTQARLARVVGLSDKHVSSLELGRIAVDLRDLRVLADALGVTVTRLTADDPTA
jgi:transcriptional regulator with XRE-family HTH domain